MRSFPNGICTTGRWAFRDGDEPRRVRALQLVQPHPVDRHDLVGRRSRVESSAAPEHDRGDDVSGPGRVVVEQTQHRGGGKFDADFLVQLSKRRIDRILPWVQSTTRKRPLRRMRVEAGRPAAQQECGPAGYVDHAAVEAGLRHRASRYPVVHRRRIDPVLADLRLDEQHRHGRVPLRRVGYDSTVMTGHMVPDPLAQCLVIRDGHHPSLSGAP